MTSACGHQFRSRRDGWTDEGCWVGVLMLLAYSYERTVTHLLAYSCRGRWRLFWPDLQEDRRKRTGGWNRDMQTRSSHTANSRDMNQVVDPETAADICGAQPGSASHKASKQHREIEKNQSSWTSGTDGWGWEDEGT